MAMQGDKNYLNGAIRHKQETREAVGSGGGIREANVPIVAATLALLSRKTGPTRLPGSASLTCRAESALFPRKNVIALAPLPGGRLVRRQDEYRVLTDIGFLRCKISRSL
jgi:hypothetical protein